jgi:hypothetical protein
MRMAAVFVVSTTNIGRFAGIYPRWFILFSFAVAAAMFLSASLNYWLIVVFPVWVLVLSGLLYAKARLISTHVPALRPAGNGPGFIEPGRASAIVDGPRQP